SYFCVHSAHILILHRSFFFVLQNILPLCARYLCRQFAYWCLDGHNTLNLIPFFHGNKYHPGMAGRPDAYLTNQIFSQKRHSNLAVLQKPPPTVFFALSSFFPIAKGSGTFPAVRKIPTSNSAFAGGHIPFRET